MARWELSWDRPAVHVRPGHRSVPARRSQCPRTRASGYMATRREAIPAAPLDRSGFAAVPARSPRRSRLRSALPPKRHAQGQHRDPGVQPVRAHAGLSSRAGSTSAAGARSKSSSSTTVRPTKPRPRCAGRRPALPPPRAATAASSRPATTARRLARGEYLVFLNNDTVPQPGWLDALLRHLRRAPAHRPCRRATAVSGRTPAGSRRHRLRRRQLLELRPLRIADDPRYAYVREVDYCSGAAIAVPRALFARLGGFDTRYAPAYYEDTDLAFAVRAAGLRVAVPACVARSAYGRNHLGHGHQ